MKFTLLSPFREMFQGPSEHGLVGTAISKSLIQLKFINPRDFSHGVHQSIDARPFGGGDGMLMSPEPWYQAISKFREDSPKGKLIYLSPQGKSFTQDVAKELKAVGDVGFLCGRYAGVDERLIAEHVDMELSIGDYILSGAELASMVIIDAVSRLVPGVLGNTESPEKESFEGSLLEWPQFTRPREFQGMEVPEVLLSGDHKKIEDWRRKMSILRTLHRRPDLISKSGVSEKEIDDALALYEKMSPEERKICGLQGQSKQNI